jgi:hypothetical protein
MDAAGRAAKELGAAIRVVKMSSSEYELEDDPPPCPSVAVDGRLIAEDAMVTYEALERAIRDGGPANRTAS